MSSDRYHKAAKEGILEILKETTRKDCNARDDQEMTPTLYAAFHGHLDALRLLCGRGGDPDKSDVFGNTALHLATTQGHKHIVTFLANFGANIYAKDIDGRTPQELAGINNREDILRFLDDVQAKLEAVDKKKVKTLKEKAQKDSEKRLKEFNKVQDKKENEQRKWEKKTMRIAKPSVMDSLKSKYKFKSGSMSNLSNIGTVSPNSFSAIVGSGTLARGKLGTIQRKLLFRTSSAAPDFKISEVEDGKRSVKSIKGIRSLDSEVIYGTSLDNTKRGKLNGIFNEEEEPENEPKTTKNVLIRTLSQPDFMHNLKNENDSLQYQEPASIFVRPGIGSLAFRKSMFSALFGLNNTITNPINDENDLANRKTYLDTIEDEFSDAQSADEDDQISRLGRFLAAWDLEEHLPKFEEQKIDLDTLVMLTETDLKSLNLPLGHHRKLVIAINERKSALEA